MMAPVVKKAKFKKPSIPEVKFPKQSTLKQVGNLNAPTVPQYTPSGGYTPPVTDAKLLQMQKIAVSEFGKRFRADLNSPIIPALGAMSYMSGDESLGGVIGGTLGSSAATAGASIAKGRIAKSITNSKANRGMFSKGPLGALGRSTRLGKVLGGASSLIATGIGYTAGSSIGNRLVPIHKREVKLPPPPPRQQPPVNIHNNYYPITSQPGAYSHAK